MNQEIEKLKADGFAGFVSVSKLRQSCNVIPDVKGVYVVLRLSEDAPHFLTVGTGGFFKGKCPNVAVDELKSNWVNDTHIVYIGKAGDPGRSATLRSRIRQYINFGMGKNVGHYGGRYIWQLSDASELVFAWKQLPDGYPSAVESQMIADFKLNHKLMRPFANLKD